MQTHSLFFDALRLRGHILDYIQAESPELRLKNYGVYQYDNIVLFCPSVQDMNTITNEGVYASP